MTALLLPLAVCAQDATPETMDEMVIGQDMMSACPPPPSLPGTVNIGAIFALSGAASVYGLSQQQAVNLAVQQMNDWGYLGSTTLAVQFEDSTGTAEQAINAMTKLTEDDRYRRGAWPDAFVGSRRRRPGGAGCRTCPSSA